MAAFIEGNDVLKRNTLEPIEPVYVKRVLYYMYQIGLDIYYSFSLKNNNLICSC